MQIQTKFKHHRPTGMAEIREPYNLELMKPKNPCAPLEGIEAPNTITWDSI